MFPLTNRITFCTTRVVRESISFSFTMFTGARILLASDTGTMTASEDGFDDTRTPCHAIIGSNDDGNGNGNGNGKKATG